MAEDFVIEMLHITKEFPGIKANDDITLQLRKGEVHALLGENGAGKSTLMSVLFGLYQPEEGKILKNGKEVAIRKAEGEAQAILNVQQALADSIKMLNEANPNEQVIKIKALESFEKAADGQATKIIVPSEIQSLAGLAASFKGLLEDEKK